MSELIDREKLKSAIRNKFTGLSDRCEINEIINAQPTVDSVVHGHWIFKDSTGGGFTEPIDTYICSKCGKVSEMSCAYISKDNFCKNCGAKMDEDTEREDE